MFYFSFTFLKQGGTTLYDIIDRQYSPNTIYSIKGNKIQESINDFLKLSEGERNKIRCVKGHMPFGLHGLVDRPSFYITMLRDPVERFISDYYYVLTQPTHPDYRALINSSIEEALIRKIEREDVNLQTRWISGYVDLDTVLPPYEPLPEAALEVAKENLEKYFLVAGTVEKFDETLLLMKRKLGWRDIVYRRKNVTKKKRSRESINRKTIVDIKNSNRLDMELYNFVRRRLEKQINEQEKFRYELRKFRILNKIYNASMGFKPHIGNFRKFLGYVSEK